MLTAEQVDRLVRGRDTGGHFDLLLQPKREFAASRTQSTRASLRRYRQNDAEQTEWHEGPVAPV
jgi:hypothetical protein